MTTTKTLRIGLAAAIALSLAVGSASGNFLSINERDAKAEWSELTFVSPVGGNVVCPLTLEGRLHSRTIRKVERALIGAITRAEIGTCTTGRTSVYKETLPWHLTYEGFVGRLPAIEAIRLLLARGRFRIENGTATCNARFGAEAGGNLSGIEPIAANGQVTRLRIDETRGIGLEGGGLCGLAQGRFAGEARFSTLPTLNLVFIRLI